MSAQRASVNRSIGALQTLVWLLTCVYAEVLNERGFETSTVMAVWTFKWFISLMNAHVTPHCHLGRKLLVTEVAAELFPSRDSESNRCVNRCVQQVSHSVLYSFIAFFPCHKPVFHPVLPNVGPQLWLHPSQAFWIPGGCVKLLVFSTVNSLFLLTWVKQFVLGVNILQGLIP